MKTRSMHLTMLLLFAGVWSVAKPGTALEAADFDSPPMECRPHTRWWWMGNALRPEDITFQLEQMKAQGLSGVEQVSMEEVYEKGNHEYLSPEYFELVTYAIAEAKRLGLEFSLNFGGPGWIWGGEWVPEEDRSMVLLSSALELEGPARYDGPLSKVATLNPNDLPRSVRDIGPEDRLVAAAAGRVIDGCLQPDSLIDVSACAKDGAIAWDVPEGHWRVMGFWTTRRNNSSAVNHLDKGAMTRYCDRLGAQFETAFGEEFGHTVESLFSDSFEVPIQRNGIYWADGLFGVFKERYGYDLVPMLPAVWWPIEGFSPKIRYDVNEFLHTMGMEAFFDTFLGWCEAHGVKGRIQPYGFVTDNIEGAGRAHLPEMEITAGEKDAVPWFDTRIGPKKYVASGAHLYGRTIVTTEAYTYQHWQPYRATLEELKLAGDVFFKSGTNKIYNHGYTASPERDIAPSRGFFAAIHVSHDNTWWRYYRHLADYQARCCYLLRQGSFVADLAVYSPLANQWAKDALNARKWTREFDWGGLGELLMANGYDFDLINDDVLQHRTTFDGGALCVRDLRYRVLVLPDVETIPLESLERIAAYAESGGTVVALERVPAHSTGLRDAAAQDAAVQALSEKLFDAPRGRDGTGAKDYGQGRTYQLHTVMHRTDMLDWRSAPLDPFLKVLHAHATPDIGLDLVRMGLRRNEGLTHIHRRTPDSDIYFLTNLQDRAVDTEVAFHVSGRVPFLWDPYTGAHVAANAWRAEGDTTVLPLRLAPYGSMCYVFESSPETSHVTRSDFAAVDSADSAGFLVRAERNGLHRVEWTDGTQTGNAEVDVEGLPAPFTIEGEWQLALEGRDFPLLEKTLTRLESWTEDPATRHFSGTGRYCIAFDVPEAYCTQDIALTLDLGDVGGVAEVWLNDTPLGTAWMRGQSFDATAAVKAGPNQLVLDVTNTFINRVSGWTSVPEVPEELQYHFGKTLDPETSPAKTLLGFEPLPRSGLLGPVLLRTEKQVRVAAK